MRFVIQRVCEASVAVEGQVIGQIGHGLLVFVGVADSDDKLVADKMIDKLTKLRIFDDADGKTNLSIADVGGKFLVISQFTLYADCRKGNSLVQWRPVRHLQVMQDHQMVPFLQLRFYRVGRIMDDNILPQTGKQKCLLSLVECYMGLFCNFQRRAPCKTSLRHCQHLGKGPVFFHCHI